MPSEIMFQSSDDETITPIGLVHAGFASWIPFSINAGVGGEAEGFIHLCKVNAFRMGSSSRRLA